MELDSLTAIAPVDGRYRSKCEAVASYFSEYALIRYRTLVEVEYFITLSNAGLPEFSPIGEGEGEQLRALYRDFGLSNAKRVKALEKDSNHDVKAVEYFVKEGLDAIGLSDRREFVHFGLTSQDINNTAFPLALKTFHENELLPAYQALVERLSTLGKEWGEVPMLARTHGQPASPTRVGKEVLVFVERLEAQLRCFEQIPFAAKFGGATGNFNAHHAAYPDKDWASFADHFIEEMLGLQRTKTTTQIEHYDHMAAYFQTLERLNTILIDLDRDLWTYISMDRFKQRTEKDEVGSSTMPHKVNPIDLENSEGNFGLANSMFQHLASKLPVSRMQRDLTDSTVIRNLGLPLAHTLLAIDSLIKGLNKLQVNEEVLRRELDANWNVLSEAIQTVLRREGFSDPYETIRELTRDQDKLDREAVRRIIEELDVEERVKEELRNLSPHNYTGI
ncbi:MAG: adenylosuccinate lyase [Flavobacteriales bacterium]